MTNTNDQTGPTGPFPIPTPADLRRRLGPFSPAEIRTLLHIYAYAEPLPDTAAAVVAEGRFRMNGLIKEANTPSKWMLTDAGEAVVRHWMQPLVIVTKAIVAVAEGTEL